MRILVYYYRIPGLADAYPSIHQNTGRQNRV